MWHETILRFGAKFFSVSDLRANSRHAPYVAIRATNARVVARRHPMAFGRGQTSIHLGDAYMGSPSGLRFDHCEVEAPQSHIGGGAR